MVRVIAATAMTEDPFASFSFDGILGLGLEALAITPEFSLFNMLAKEGRTSAIERPILGVFLANNDDEISEISFGGVSPDKFSTELTWAPVALPALGYWQVPVKAIIIGDRRYDFCDDGSCRAVVDTGTSLLAVPTDFASTLRDTLAESLQRGSQRSRGCKNAEGASLHFEMEAGFNITLTPADYGRQAIQLDENVESGTSTETDAVAALAQGKSTNCTPTILSIAFPEPLGPKLFIWGEPVLRKYYTAFDWREKRVGFALSVHADDKDDDDSAAEKENEEEGDTVAASIKQEQQTPKLKPLLR